MRQTHRAGFEFLCDLKPGEQVTLTGPHGLPFEVFEDHTANLILFCTGTGIAPFRAFVKYLYEKVPDWTGPVWLFYGAKNPLETLYMNDEQDDFANYYDLDSFVAFKALGPNPRWPDSIPWDRALDARADELLAAFSTRPTRVSRPVRRRCARRARRSVRRAIGLSRGMAPPARRVSRRRSLGRTALLSQASPLKAAVQKTAPHEVG
ncbi:MAG: hypothetical protein R2748_04375 [Bryobacterales bacterium]